MWEPRSCDDVEAVERVELRTAELGGVEVATRWNATFRSFKGPALRLAARRAALFGFRHLALPACSSGVEDLVRWCGEQGLRLTVLMPAEQRAAGGALDEAHARVTTVVGGWPAVHAALWELTAAQPDVYPLYPSGDPWYLSALRDSASQVLEAFPARPIVVPCGSGLHLLAYLEEAEASGASNSLVGVQLRGFDPLAEGGAVVRPDPAACAVASMLSQAPVNAVRIREALRRRAGARVLSIPQEAMRLLAPELEAIAAQHLGTVDDSLAACIAAVRTGDLRNAVVLSTAGFDHRASTSLGGTDPSSNAG